MFMLKSDCMQSNSQTTKKSVRQRVCVQEKLIKKIKGLNY